MDTLRSIECFVQTVEAGSIAGAAKRLGISSAAVSQNIRRLEARLSDQLLTRTNRNIDLTRTGEIYYDHVKNITRDIDLAHDAIRSLEDKPFGKLHIVFSENFSRHAITPKIPIFNALYPNITLELLTTENDTSVITEEYDVIRFASQPDDRLTSYSIFSFSFIFCAAPKYLERCGLPQDPEELMNHDCLMFRPLQNNHFPKWKFLFGGKHYEPSTKVAMISNDIIALTQATLSGGGISQLPDFIVQPYIVTGELVPLFRALQDSKSYTADETMNIYLSVSDQCAHTLKAKALINFLIGQFSHPCLR